MVDGKQAFATLSQLRNIDSKRLVKKMIEEEDSTKPLTDEQIAKKLDDTGIHVTRRTVAKYREDMRIPSTHQRRVKN